MKHCFKSCFFPPSCCCHFKKLTYLQGRVTENMLPFIDSLPSWLELGQCGARSFLWVCHLGSGTQYIRPLSFAFPGHQQGAIRSAATCIQTSARIGCQPIHSRRRTSQVSTSSWTVGTEDSRNVTNAVADEIMSRVVKSAMQVPSQRVVPWERKRSQANRKSLRRTLKSDLTPEEARALAGTSELQL